MILLMSRCAPQLEDAMTGLLEMEAAARGGLHAHAAARRENPFVRMGSGSDAGSGGSSSSSKPESVLPQPPTQETYDMGKV
jgi:hypothetical protein